MIISHILGGIGNQMFQYAAGRALSLRNEQPLLLDLNDFQHYRLHHGFELERVFNVVASEAQPHVVDQMLGWRANRLVKKVLRRRQFEWLRGRRFVVEPHSHFWPGLFNLTEDCYLYGYWQSDRYFKSFDSAIRRDFTFREALVERNADLASAIANSESISLHIRRGDYVGDSVMNVCSLAYYHKAVRYIAEHVECPVFYVFSDDLAWVKLNFPMAFPCVYVDHNVGRDSYRDMQLMSLCRHHVIANSSFSWWGAWLNPSEDKIVVAPQKWFVADDKMVDLFQTGWVSL